MRMTIYLNKNQETWFRAIKERYHKPMTQIVQGLMSHGKTAYEAELAKELGRKDVWDSPVISVPDRGTPQGDLPTQTSASLVPQRKLAAQETAERFKRRHAENGQS